MKGLTGPFVLAADPRPPNTSRKLSRSGPPVLGVKRPSLNPLFSPPQGDPPAVPTGEPSTSNNPPTVQPDPSLIVREPAPIDTPPYPSPLPTRPCSYQTS